MVNTQKSKVGEGKITPKAKSHGVSSLQGPFPAFLYGWGPARHQATLPLTPSIQIGGSMKLVETEDQEWSALVVAVCLGMVLVVIMGAILGGIIHA